MGIQIDTSGIPFKKLWETTGHPKDFDHRPHVGALQYSIILSTGNIMSSYHCYGDTSGNNSEFIRWNKDGKLLDAMLVKGGGHAGSFWYNENSNLLHTQVRDENNGDYYLGTLEYKPNKVVSINDLNKWFKVSHYYRVSIDNTYRGYWLGSTMNGSVSICKVDDLMRGSFTPVKAFNLTDYGYKPLPAGKTNNGSYNTIQANGFSYPYAFFTSGDANNKDPRKLLCINVETLKVEFDYQIDTRRDFDLQVPVSSGGHLEPEGIYKDSFSQNLIVGFNITKKELLSKTNRSSLYKIPLIEV